MTGVFSWRTAYRMRGVGDDASVFRGLPAKRENLIELEWRSEVAGAGHLVRHFQREREIIGGLFDSFCGQVD